MLRRTSLLLAAFSVALSVAACGDDDGDSAGPSATLGTSTTEADAPTTTAELTVEQEVEAAYLRSWEVFKKAALELDPTGLDEAYAGPALEVVRGNIARYVDGNTPVRYEVEHDYVIELVGDIAEVRDTYVNHSVFVDPDSGEPTEPDPNETLTETYLLQRIEGEWKVVDILRA